MSSSYAFEPADLSVGSAHDPAEREADRMADAAVAGPLPRAEGLPAASGGPLEPPARAFFERRLGAGLGAVRVHTGSAAAGSARALAARAFALGNDVVFGAGEYSPGTPRGARLLAHELTHVIQQRGGRPVLRRQPQPGAEEPSPFQLPPLTLPGTDVTLTPGPPGRLLGERIAIPASLRVSNLGGLNLGAAPRFFVDLGPRTLVGGLLGNIDLHSSTRPGTPPDDVSEGSRSRISLVNPVLRLDPAVGRLSGSAVLSIGSEYPPAFKGPTEIDVRIASTELGEFSGELGYGPLRGNFELSLRYDTARLGRSLAELGSELTHPGFQLSGGLRLGPLPLSTFSASAPTTRPLDRPLLGAPAPFPLTASAGGVILAPPGALFPTAVPALGYTRSSFGGTSGTSLTAAFLPTLSPSAISAGEGPVRMFPVYAYVEVTHVRRVSSGLDLGISATLQIDTPTLFGGPRPGEAPAPDQPPTPNIGARVFGRFSGL